MVEKELRKAKRNALINIDELPEGSDYSSSEEESREEQHEIRSA